MSKRMLRKFGSVLVMLAVFLAAFCSAFPSSEPAFALEPTMSATATNGDSNDPYYGTEFVDPEKLIIVKIDGSCTGLKPNTQYRFLAGFEYSKNGTVTERLSGWSAIVFTTDAQGAATFDGLYTMNKRDKGFDTVRSLCSVLEGDTYVIAGQPADPNLTAKEAPQPAISSTTATNASDGSKLLPYNDTATVQDVVSYSNLCGGDTYKIKTVVVSKTVNPGAILASDTVSFTPSSSSGEATVTISFDTSGYDYDDEFVVYEYILDSSDTVLAKHEDIDDPAQTVRIEGERVSVSAKKEWQNADGTKTDAPEGASVTLQLLADGVDYGTPVTLSATEGWAHTWTDLPKVSAKTGKDAVYTVKEVAIVAEGFVPGTVEGDMAKGFVITNKRQQEPPAPTVNVTAKKVWTDVDGTTVIEAPEGASVTLQLFADGVDYGMPVTLSATEGWAYTWTDLPQVSAKTGKDIVYTVKETDFTAEGFEAGSVEGDMVKGFVMTNKRQEEPPAPTVNVTAQAEWQNADGSKTDAPEGASVTLQLFADGVDYGTPVTLSATEDWAYTWTDLPKVSAKTGKDIVYTVKEVAFTAEGFEFVAIEGDMAKGFAVTIKRQQEPPAPTVNVTAKKVWTDVDGTTVIEAPEGASVTLQLFADGVDYGTPVVINASMGWTYTWADLPQMSAKTGKDIVYTVKETDFTAEGFEAGSVEGDMVKGFVVTNKRLQKPPAPNKDDTDKKNVTEKKKASPTARTSDVARLGLVASIAVAGIALAAAGVALAMSCNTR